MLSTGLKVRTCLYLGLSNLHAGISSSMSQTYEPSHNQLILLFHLSNRNHCSPPSFCSDCVCFGEDWICEDPYNPSPCLRLAPYVHREGRSKTTPKHQATSTLESQSFTKSNGRQTNSTGRLNCHTQDTNQTTKKQRTGIQDTMNPYRGSTI